MNPETPSGRFPTTHWHEVKAGAEPAAAAGEAALEALVRKYQPPLLAHIADKFPVTAHEAEDLFQSFVERKVLQDRLLWAADPQRGRFRTFLLNTLDNFVVSELRRWHAKKRAPEQAPLALDELTDKDTPRHEDRSEVRVELLWAQAVLAGALLNMRKECADGGRTDIWGVFESRILRTVLDEDQPPMDYDELIREFGFESPSQAFNVLNTAKRMFRRHLKSVIAEYARDDKEVEEEIQQLKRMLDRAEGKRKG